MSKYLIRYNKTHGQEGRGSDAHVRRVIENAVEHLATDVMINVPSWVRLMGRIGTLLVRVLCIKW